MSAIARNPASPASERDYEASPVSRPEHREDEVTRLIEQQTAKIPSKYFLAAALASMGVSLAFELMDRERPSRFVGMWPAPLLILGLYNKIVKTLGTR